MRWFVSIWLLGAAACQTTPEEQQAPALIVAYPTALHEKPGEKSPETVPLEAGDRLAGPGEVSALISGITLNDTFWQEPWLRVKTAGGREGWVFSAAVRPADLDAAGIRQWRLNNRFAAWFGPRLAQRRQAWAQTPAPQTDTACARYAREGFALRDTLNLLISRRVSYSAGAPLPDMFWLGELLPLFLVQQTGNGTGYHLFTEYRVLSRWAGASSGSQDDAFVRVCLQAYPADSIESFLPVWVFPLSAEAGCSNLGQGEHLKLLRAIDQAMSAGDLFQPELIRLKNRVLEDISGKDQTYWQSGDKIRAEMNAILNAGLRCLDDRDRIALEARRGMFERPEENGIVLDRRSGR